MIRLEGMASQSERLEHASDSFKLQSMNKSRSRLLPDIQLNFQGFLTEFKSNSLESLEQSKEAALVKHLFGLDQAPPHECLAHSLNQLPSSEQSSPFKRRNGRLLSESSQDQAQASMYVAYPETNKCFVCKQMFQNYFKHISSTKHKKNQKRINENKKFIVEQKLSQLINSVNKSNKGGSNETNQRISARFQQNQAHDIDPFFQGSFLSKRRLLSNGHSVYLKSSDSTSLIHLSSRSRKRSCFEQ